MYASTSASGASSPHKPQRVDPRERAVAHVPIQVDPTCVPDGILGQEPSACRVVVAVGEQNQAGLAVSIIPPLPAKAKRGGVAAGGGIVSQAIGIEEVAGEDVTTAVEALAGVALRVEGVEAARAAIAAKEQVAGLEGAWSGGRTDGPCTRIRRAASTAGADRRPAASPACSTR